MSGSGGGVWPEWVVHAHRNCGVDRRLYLRYRPFVPGCPQHATQRPFGSSRRSSLTGQARPYLNVADSGRALVLSTRSGSSNLETLTFDYTDCLECNEANGEHSRHGCPTVSPNASLIAGSNVNARPSCQAWSNEAASFAAARAAATRVS